MTDKAQKYDTGLEFDSDTGLVFDNDTGLIYERVDLLDLGDYLARNHLRIVSSEWPTGAVAPVAHVESVGSE